MPEEQERFLTEESKKEYIVEFWDNLEPMIKKDIMKKKALKTKFKIKNVPSPDIYGQKRLIELVHDKRKLSFTMMIKPWLWQDGSVQVEFDLVKTKNIVIPKRKILRGQKMHAVWRPGESDFWFIRTMEPVTQYIKAIELTMLDVSLFDNLEQAAKKLLG